MLGERAILDTTKNYLKQEAEENDREYSLDGKLS
jgi:hypothetical protein